MSHKNMVMPAGLSLAEAFFWREAGWSYAPGKETPEQGRAKGAKALARAERFASERGYAFEWSQDDYTSAEWLSDSDPDVIANGGHWLTWVCVARDESGNSVASLSGVDFGPDGDPWGSTYRRVVEAELALEAIGSQQRRRSERKRSAAAYREARA